MARRPNQVATGQRSSANDTPGESSVDAAKMMLQKGNATRAEAKEELEKIREMMNALDERKNKLLDQTLRVQDGNCQKQKAEGEEKPAKKKGGIGKHQIKGESLG